jgi:hypothetical protein
VLNLIKKKTMKKKQFETYYGKFCRIIKFDNNIFTLVRYAPIGILTDIINQNLSPEIIEEVIKDIDEQMLLKYQLAYFHECGLLRNKDYYKIARKIWEEYKHSPKIYERPEEKDLGQKTYERYYID